MGDPNHHDLLNGSMITMVLTWRDILAAALLTVLASSCSTSPPGAGLTNGDKATFTADEKPAIRDDLRGPTESNAGDARLAESAASSPAAPGNEAGSGGRNSRSADATGAMPRAIPSATPPTNNTDSAGASGAQGATKPPDNIQTGTPRSPQ
jgi:hypothetical protein